MTDTKMVDGAIVPMSAEDIAQRAADLAACVPDLADVVAERTRRLAAGFDYNFGDARGTKRIGTTDADMAGWREVTDLASAYLAQGQPSSAIDIVTNSGPVSVTAMEWQSILIAAATFRQPIWAAGFALEATKPIPADYAADIHWP